MPLEVTLATHGGGNQISNGQCGGMKEFMYCESTRTLGVGAKYSDGAAPADASRAAPEGGKTDYAVDLGGAALQRCDNLKMNYNNADIADGEPITLKFAGKISEILSYIPEMKTRPTAS